jgi:hypothetical protein
MFPEELKRKNIWSELSSNNNSWIYFFHLSMNFCHFRPARSKHNLPASLTTFVKYPSKSLNQMHQVDYLEMWTIHLHACLLYVGQTDVFVYSCINFIKCDWKFPLLIVRFSLGLTKICNTYCCHRVHSGDAHINTHLGNFSLGPDHSF